jgi:hypothetical protein
MKKIAIPEADTNNDRILMIKSLPKVLLLAPGRFAKPHTRPAMNVSSQIRDY